MGLVGRSRTLRLVRRSTTMIMFLRVMFFLVVNIATPICVMIVNLPARLHARVLTPDIKTTA